jgi:hypothetical protein
MPNPTISPTTPYTSITPARIDTYPSYTVQLYIDARLGTTASKSHLFHRSSTMSKSKKSKTTPNSNHDAKGRFTFGNKGGPGNPHARQTAKLHSAALCVINEKEMEDIFKEMAKLAKEGNVHAARFVAEYTIGKPMAAVNPDRVDFDEWQRHSETTGLQNDMMHHAVQPSPEFVVQVIRAFRMAQDIIMSQQLRDVWDACKNGTPLPDDPNNPDNDDYSDLPPTYRPSASAPTTPAATTPDAGSSERDSGRSRNPARQEQPAPSPNGPNGDHRRASTPTRSVSEGRRDPSTGAPVFPSPSASEGRSAPAPSPNVPNGDRTKHRSTVNGKKRTVNGAKPPSPNGPNGDSASKRIPATRSGARTSPSAHR